MIHSSSLQDDSNKKVLSTDKYCSYPCMRIVICVEQYLVCSYQLTGIIDLFVLDMHFIWFNVSMYKMSVQGGGGGGV